MPIDTIHQDGDNEQLRKVIFDATPLAIQQTKSIAKQFQGKTEIDTCKNIFDYLLNKITYKADGHHQQVKLPSALLRERVGDCKSYSVFTYAILTNLGIGCKYVLTSYNQNPSPSHIYVVTDSGIIIDAVWGKFNSEKQPTYRYLKKIEDMKISRITGINTDENLRIGGSCCPPTRIGLTSGQWADQNKGLVDSGDKRVHVAAVVPAKAMRLLFLEFIKANGGGIATSIYLKIYRAADTKVQIPKSIIDGAYARIADSAIKNGVKIPTERQKQAIKTLQDRSNITLDASSSTTTSFTPIDLSTFDPSKATLDLIQGYEKIYNQIMGAGQYALNQRFYAIPLKNELARLEQVYTLGNVKEADLFNYREFLKSWYRFGGNPNDIRLAVLEGKGKRPKGKDANYMLMIAKTRGLKVKDLGLIIRGILSAFTGEGFDWGSKDTYMFGSNNNKIGIGEPVTVATVTAWISAISLLFGLIAKIFDYVDSKKDESKAKEEVNKLTTDGYIIEQDYYSLPIPRKQVIDIKQIAMPTAEAPSFGEIGSAVEFFSGFFTSNTSAPSTTPPTLAEFESKAKQGSVPPYIAQEIDNAKKDKYTLEALQKATQVTSNLVPQSGETIITLYKLGDKGGETAGYGNVILPLLIGVGALIALNKKKN